MIETMDKSYGVLACIPSNNIVLIIPSDVTKIDETFESIVSSLKIPTLLVDFQ